MAFYNYNYDYKIGKWGEKVVTNYLCKKQNGVLVSTNNTNTHDVIINFQNTGEQSFEIKTDVYVVPGRRLSNGYYAQGKDTKNMFIEMECRGKKSGIRVTKARWFITYFKYFGEIWIIETKNLKNLIKSNNFVITYKSGDVNSNTRGYLIPRFEFKDHFIIKKI